MSLVTDSLILQQRMENYGELFKYSKVQLTAFEGSFTATTDGGKHFCRVG